MPSKQEDKDPKIKTPKKRRSRRKKNKNYKIHKDSDSDSDWLPAEHHSDGEDDTEESVEDMNPRELQKFIQKIFPSQAGQERIRQLERIDAMMDKKSKSKKASKNEDKETKNKKAFMLKIFVINPM